MKQDGSPFPEHLFYEGDVAIGNTLNTQIKHEEALFQIKKKNLFLKEELDSRRSNLRNFEEEIDLREKKVKQEITDLRTDTCLRLLQIQQETENILQLQDAATNTLKRIKQKILKNQKLIDNEKEKIINAQNFVITTTQYNEVLQEQNRNLKNDVIFYNNDYQIKAQITWYSNEYDVLDSKISQITSRLPSYDSDSRLLSVKIDEKCQHIQQLKAIKHQVKKSYPQKDDILLNQKKIKQLQKEAHRILNIVREYHEIQKDLVSRITNLTTRLVKCDIMMHKLEKYIKHVKKKEDPNKDFVFQKMIIDDDSKRSNQIIKSNSNKICQVTDSIKEQRISLERQISDAKSAFIGHKETILFLQQQISDYSQQQKSLNEQLLEYQELSAKYDQKYQKINEKIDKIDAYLIEKENSKKGLVQQMKNQKFADPLSRPIQYELNQIHDESNLKLKVNYVLDQISLLKEQISQYENNNEVLRYKIKRKEKKIDNNHNNSKNSASNIELSINKLKPLIIDLERKISKKEISISKKKDQIKYKITVINDAQQCIKESENCLVSLKGANKNVIKINDIKKWIIHIEREILKWELENIDESIITYLHRWNKKLPDFNSDAYSEVSD